MSDWTVDDVMTKAVISVDKAASYRSVVDLLIERRVGAIPVVDESQRVSGVVSEADVLRKIEYAGDEKPRLFDSRRRRGDRGKALARTAADLMSAPPVTAHTGTSIAAAARLMDAEKVKHLPVVDYLGRLIGIVSRSDLLKVHLRADDDIRRDIETTVLRRVPGGDPIRVTADVANGVATLHGKVDRATTVDVLARMIRQVPGVVVAVVDDVAFEYDDRNALETGIGFGAA